ncbi:phosphoenolpyruvate--protein phosphotransferase [Halopolyspora algeriensis]|nr:phosphoenolpyruvate--protein phosphotransferase [Halopolyspora algeriensis]
MSGVGVSSGRAAGPLVRVAEPLPDPPTTPTPADPDSEATRIRPAAEAVANHLFTRAAGAGSAGRTILETTAAMAMDPALISRAEQQVTEQALPAARAVLEAADTFADALREAGGYLSERIRDVRDVRDRIIAELLGVAPPGVPALEGPSVLLARDLAPADTADLDPELVLALVTEEGGPTSHTAILARSLGIPAVVAVRGILSVDNAVAAVVDGEAGTVEVSDRPVRIEAAEHVTDRAWNGIGTTADGMRVSVLANVGSVTDTQTAVEAAAQGVGLFRTEFCYLAASDEPDVDTQRSAYAEVLTAFTGKPVVVRTLDAGADKPLPFLDSGTEPNPALGVRGVRVSFERTAMLERQLEAIAAAAADSGAEVAVMAPMISTVSEAIWFVERARAAGIRRAGVMVEVPAAALSIREILGAVDFVSIGTNDLAQYVFAADRTLGALAELNDPWQPALLRMIATIGHAGEELGKPVGVCGEAAADPLLARVLVGLGVTSLSMVAASVPAVGSALAGHSLAVYRQAAEEALAAPDPARAREAVHAVLG